MHAACCTRSGSPTVAAGCGCTNISVRRTGLRSWDHSIGRLSRSSRFGSTTWIRFSAATGPPPAEPSVWTRSSSPLAHGALDDDSSGRVPPQIARPVRVAALLLSLATDFAIDPVVLRPQTLARGQYQRRSTTCLSASLSLRTAAPGRQGCDQPIPA